MTDTTTNETPNYSPYATYSDRVRMPEIKENEAGVLTVEFDQLEPLENRVGIRLTFGNTTQREAAQAIINNPPKTVGQLWHDYIRLVATHANTAKNLAGLENGLSEVNNYMNNYADDNNLCGDYEDALYKFTRFLTDNGYTGWFDFTGRMEQVTVTVERTRTVREYMTVNMERTKGDENVDFALEIAETSEAYEWTISDEEYDTSDYEVTDITVD